MANRRSPSQIPDGSATGSGSAVDRWKYTCRLCGVAFFEAVHPDSMTDPLCHACYTGRRKGLRAPTQREVEEAKIDLDDIELGGNDDGD